MSTSRAARRADAADNARRIVVAAREVFARTPPGSLDDVARVADVGIATLYRHFGNRDALLREVFIEIFETELAPLLAEVHTESPETFTDVIERIVELTATEAGGLTPQNLTLLSGELMERFMTPFATMLAAAQEAGTVRSDLRAADIGPLLIVMTSGLSVPQLDRRVRRRFIVLLLDALRPEHATDLPPLPEHFDPSDVAPPA